MHIALLALLGGAATAVARPGGSHVLHEKRDAEPRAWVKVEPVHAETLLPMRIGLLSKHVQAHAMLLEV